jgi:hypothetical protein
MAKKEFNTEADIRNFKSKIFLLPKKLQLEIQQMADDGKREWAIENHIKANYKGTLGTPTPPTIGTWLDWYEAKKKLAIQMGTVIEPTRTEMAIVEKSEVLDVVKEHRNILDSTTDITNKKDLLERLIRKCIQRMKHVETIQEMEGTTSSLEAVVGHYLREIHSMVQTQLKLSGELAEESNAHVKDMINTNVYKLTQLFFTVVMSVAPEKIEDIKAKFYEELKSQHEVADALKDVI